MKSANCLEQCWYCRHRRAFCMDYDCDTDYWCTHPQASGEPQPTHKTILDRTTRGHCGPNHLHFKETSFLKKLFRFLVECQYDAFTKVNL